MRSMMHDDHDDMNWRLVARYLSHECTPAERATVERWMHDSAERRREIELLRAAWDASARRPNGDRARLDAALTRFARRSGLSIGGAASPAPAAPSLRASPAPRARVSLGGLAALGARRRSRAGAIAFAFAASAIVAVAGALAWRAVGRRAPADAPVAMGRELATQPGQRATIHLADGTEVILAPASRLRLAAGFERGGGPRVVELDGEAYFDVAHDERRPFRIHTTSAVAEDIGTAFVVRAYDADTVTEVAVLDGEVAFRPRAASGARGVALVRGQVGRVRPSGLVSVTSGADVDAFLARLQGHLEFRKTPLAEICAALERWYGVRVELSDSTLARVPVSVQFDDEPVDAAFRRLARLLTVRYVRHGTLVRLTAEPRTG
jgi:transmembrane sensor